MEAVQYEDKICIILLCIIQFCKLYKEVKQIYIFVGDSFIALHKRVHNLIFDVYMF